MDNDELDDLIAEVQASATLAGEVLMENIESMSRTEDDRQRIREMRQAQEVDPSFSHKEVQKYFDEMHQLLLRAVPTPVLDSHGPKKLPVLFLPQLEGLNASAQLQDGSPIIVMNSGVVSELVFINRLLVRCFDPTADADARKSRQAEFCRIACPNFKRVMTNSQDISALVRSVKEHADLVVKSVLEPWGFMLGEQLLTWEQYFILCHEMAHHVLGHLADAPMTALDVGGGEHVIRIISPSWAQEYAADELATQWCLGTLWFMEEQDLQDEILLCAEWAAAAPDIFLQLIQFLQFGTKQQNDGSPTHPPAIRRRQSLVSKYRREIEARPSALQLAAHTESLFERARRDMVGL